MVARGWWSVLAHVAPLGVCSVSPAAIAEAVEEVASSFAIASLPLEESSGGTPLQVYGWGFEDTEAVPRTLGHDVIG